MRARTNLLWILVAVPLLACGEKDKPGPKEEEPEVEAVCGNGVVEEGEACDDGNTDADDGCSPECEKEPGWNCEEDGSCIRVEICDNGEDDDDNGLVDCEDPACELADNCKTDCSGQATCSAEVAPPVVSVCADGICRIATSFDDEGNALWGDIGVYHRYETNRTQVKNLRSFQMVILHPSVPNSSEPLNCEKLSDAVRKGTLDLSRLNVLAKTNNDTATGERQGELIPMAKVPATSDAKWLVLSRFYTGARDPQTREPTGQMPAFACLEGFENPPGAWEPGRQVEVPVEPACRNNSHCPTGWTCEAMVGLCFYRQCDPACESGYVCRELPDGEPACLATCEPGDPPCPPGFRCDTTPGWRPACIEI